jgi:hypothetical protein
MNHYKDTFGNSVNANGNSVSDLKGLVIKDMQCQCITSPCNCDDEPNDLDVTDSVKDGSVDFFESVKSGAGKVVKVTKETAKDVLDEVKEQQKILDQKERLFKSVPNSFLVFGLIGLLAFSLIKK